MSTGIVTVIKKDRKVTTYKIVYKDILGYKCKYNTIVKLPNYYSKRAIKKYVVVFIAKYFTNFKMAKRKYVPLSLGNPDYDRVVFA